MAALEPIFVFRRRLLAATAATPLLGAWRWPWSAPSLGRNPPLRLLAPDSVWNLPLGAGAVLATTDDPASVQARALDGGLDLADDAWTVALWQATQTDPLQTVDVNAGPTGKNGRISIRIPRDAVASPPPWAPGMSDAHMSVISPDGRTVHEFNGARQIREGFWMASCYVPMPVDGAGIGHMEGFEISGFRLPGMLGWGSTRAYGGSSTAGLILSGELNYGISHMIAAAANLNVLSSPWVWPASRDDWHTAYPNNGGTAKVALGMIFSIPKAVDLSTMGLGRRELNLLRAVQTYGLLVSDRGGPNWSIYMDYNARDEARDLDIDSVRAVLSAHLSRVTNISPAAPKGGA